MVTTGELKGLAHLPGEIASIDKAIQDLKRPPYLKDMDLCQKAGCDDALTELIALYQEQRQTCTAQLEKLQAFIENIDDPFTRELFRLRYVRALGWVQIANRMSGGNTPDSVRMTCKRYLERYNRNEQNQNHE